MPDLASAVSALDNAGQSIQNLESAINGASFLDEIPGEERQKLRGTSRYCIRLGNDMRLGEIRLRRYGAHQHYTSNADSPLLHSAARTLLKKLKAKAAHEAALGIRSGPGLKKIAEVSPWKRDNDVRPHHRTPAVCVSRNTLSAPVAVPSRSSRCFWLCGICNAC